MARIFNVLKKADCETKVTKIKIYQSLFMFTNNSMQKNLKEA